MWKIKSEIPCNSKIFEQLSTAINEHIHFYNRDLIKVLNGPSPIGYRAKIIQFILLFDSVYLPRRSSF
ncbi:IS3 family transposase [Bacillus sp. SRB3LM]|uniref:IS3 family transposase n=1 Tax=Bacillus sp. SRB3LM TaxID=2608689 RepID=UPI0018C3BCDD|nr:IS3 family transposase [Bacillus sp. SRB3LM]